MQKEKLSAREIQFEDIEPLVNYWMNATPEQLRGMGADPKKMPTGAQFTQNLKTQLNAPYAAKKSFATIWTLDDQAIGHCNANKIVFGQEAYMHLHLWNSDRRQKGMGTELVKKSLKLFFEKLQIDCLYCEPYALNPAPNKTLAKIGFEYIKEYVTIPGSINFEQPVKRWKLSRERFETII